MIKGLWSKVRVLCGNHGDEEVEMTVHDGPFSQFYSCPKYYPQNRAKGEHACGNRINLTDYERMLNRISKMLMDFDRTIDLTNYSFEINGIEFEVVKHGNKEIWVKALNRKALNRMPSEEGEEEEV